jgi:hypothetical protein
MELALAKWSSARESRPMLLFRLPGCFEVACDDFERNRLLRLDSICFTDKMDALLSTGCSRSPGSSAADNVVGEEAVVWEEEWAVVIKAFERRLVVFEKPPGLNRPAAV